MGERLAAEAPVDADLVLPIPDSGTPAAIGFSRATGIPFSEGLIKNRYVHRTFIQPEQGMRDQGIRMKFNPLAEVAGKRLVVVDDSIVRGSTTRQIVQMLFDAGAAEVHVRVSSPPVVSPCYYGIDLASQEEMIAAREHGRGSAHNPRDLAYLSLEASRRDRRPAAPFAALASPGSTRPQSRRRQASSASSRSSRPVANDSPRRASRPAARPVPDRRSSSTRSVPSTVRSGSSVRSCSLSSSDGIAIPIVAKNDELTDEADCLVTLASPRREIPCRAE